MNSVVALALVIAFWSLFDGIVNIVRSFDLRGFVQHWWVMLLGGIVGVAFGIAALYYFPGLSLTFAVVWTAYWLTVSGVIAAYIAWQERSAGLSWGWTMAFAVLAIAAGVIAFMNPQATLAWLLGVLAGFAIISGVFLAHCRRQDGFRPEGRQAILLEYGPGLKQLRRATARKKKNAYC